MEPSEAWTTSENLRLREALGRIREEFGGVCEDYEICTHRSCRDSHAAWEVADAALNQNAEQSSSPGVTDEKVQRAATAYLAHHNAREVPDRSFKDAIRAALEAVEVGQADRRVHSDVVALESAGIVSVALDVGPVELKVLLTRDEAYHLSGELNASALQLDRAEGS